MTFYASDFPAYVDLSEDHHLTLWEMCLLEKLYMRPFECDPDLLASHLFYDHHVNAVDGKVYDLEKRSNAAYEIWLEHYEMNFFRDGYVEMYEPTYRRRTNNFEVHYKLTDLGFAAYEEVRHGFYWNRLRERADFQLTHELWTEHLETATFPGELRFNVLEKLTEPFFASIVEKIPVKRRSLWEREMRLGAKNPLSPIWSLLPQTIHPELQDLREECFELHEKAWISRIETITKPDDPVFKRIESLPDEHYRLAKAIAFQQKIMVWKPVQGLDQL